MLKWKTTDYISGIILYIIMYVSGNRRLLNVRAGPQVQQGQWTTPESAENTALAEGKFRNPPHKSIKSYFNLELSFFRNCCSETRYITSEAEFLL